MRLAPEQQIILWHGRHRAKAYKQIIHWDTTGKIDKNRVRAVYTELYGEERAMEVVCIMDRKIKEREADSKLDEFMEGG